MLIARYIFRQTASALITILLSLTLIVWLTSVLREIKLLTTEGQTFVLFFKITALALPNLIVMVAPVAFFIACLHTLNRLSGDSELIVLSASGSSPWRLLLPYLTLGTVVAAAVLAANLYVLPAASRLLQDYISQVRADILSQVLQPGEFSDLESGLTIHIRDKSQDGTLLGVLVHDERDKKTANTVIAERGTVSSEKGRAQMDLFDGQILRQDIGKNSVRFITFKTYSFDMGDFTAKSAHRQQRVEERDLEELLYPDTKSEFFKLNQAAIRSEIHQRLSSPLYSLLFTFLAVVYLGRPKTTREGRGSYLFTAFAIGALIRVAGIAGVNIVGKKLWALSLIYGLPATVTLICVLMLQFNISAPVLGIPRLRLPQFLRPGRHPASTAASPS